MDQKLESKFVFERNSVDVLMTQCWSQFYQTSDEFDCQVSVWGWGQLMQSQNISEKFSEWQTKKILK